MKRVVAVLFAAMIAAVLILGLILIGVNAWVNPRSVPPSNSPAALASMAAFLPATGPGAEVMLGLRRSTARPSRDNGPSTYGMAADRASEST